MAGDGQKANAGWTPEAESRFFEVLAASCNVTLACKEAGVSSGGVYRRRRKEASFRKQWGEALATGYAQLELEMLERALKGREKEVRVDGESRIIREYDDRMAMALLKMHRDTVGEIERGVDGAEHAEATDRILARLARMRAQLTGEVEVKRGADRLTLLSAVLRVRRRERFHAGR